MPFQKEIKETALVKSRRCCCVCHEFCGLYTNVHHMIPEAEGGEDVIENAIVLCLRCHGEAGHYNPAHPIGNKYSREELRRHRDEWWSYCERNPTKPLPNHPIAISPNSFRLVSGEWKTKLLLKVHNRTDQVLYDIALKCTIVVKGITAKDVRIDPKSTEYELTQKIDEFQFSGDLLRVNGTDSSSNEAFVIYINHLDPHQLLTFVVTNNSQQAPTPQFNQHAIMSLLGFSEEASEMLVKDNQAAVRFKSYEDWETTGVELLLQRRKGL